MSGKTVAAVLVSFVLSLPLSLFAGERADKALHGWRSVVVAPGYALATAVDANFPEQSDLAHGDWLAGLGRFMLIGIGVNCLLYAMLLYPSVRFLLLPKLARAIPVYNRDAFWMKR
jgi:hypothetical protein